MPFTSEQLDNWFTFHPPTEESTPRYQAIRAAGVECHKLVGSLVLRAQGQLAPDKTAAIRCIRLGRNAANEVIMLHVNGAPEYVDCFAEASHQLVLARWQASSAIACGGK